MDKDFIFNSIIRTENYVQDSGKVDINKIPLLKNSNYYVENDIMLTGDAPKQYIKAYIYYKNCPRKNNPRNWHGYYAKFGGKSYPHESIIEFGINKIGEALGLYMNETALVMVNGQIRFLSKDFINNKSSKLIHGVEILCEYYEDKDFVHEINQDRKKRREFLTFKEIEKAIQHVHPIQCDEILKELVKLIAFDAIVGNNDRHFYNWGVVGNIFSESNKKVNFSPIYDTARGLLWNKTEEKVLNMHSQFLNGSDEIHHFIKKSKPRFSFEENTKANHFELAEYLIRNNQNYKNIFEQLLTLEQEQNVISVLKGTIYRYLSSERCHLITEILKLRFNKLRKVL